MNARQALAAACRNFTGTDPFAANPNVSPDDVTDALCAAIRAGTRDVHASAVWQLRLLNYDIDEPLPSEAIDCLQSLT